MAKKPFILVVEDDAEMRETLSDILADKDYEVKTVGTGEAALALAKKEKLHTCLIDLKLPGITGIEVLKGLKSINPETHAIVITAYASKETAIEALKADAYCYIEKPLNMEELLAAVERASVAYQVLEDKERAEEELRKSEEKYRSLVESTEDSVYLLDMNCRYLFVNERHLSRLGLSSDQFLGHAYGDFHSAEETKEFAEKVNRVFETGVSLQHEYNENGEKWFLKTISPVKDPETGMVTAVTVVSKEVTELKRTERNLTETRDYLDNIIASSADAITVVDINGIVRDWNKSAEGIMGYRTDEVIGTSNRKFFAEPEEADRIMGRVQREGVVKNYRTIVLRKDGKPVHISMSAALLKDKNGVPIGTVRVSRDITKEVALEERIKKERDNMNLIFESMVDGVYVISEDYEVEFMNKVSRDAFGDQIGDICYKVFHGREEPCPLCKHSEVLKGKIERWEWHSRRADKSYDLIETPLRGFDGTISKLTMFRDVTEQKRAEEALRESKERLSSFMDTATDSFTLFDSELNFVEIDKTALERLCLNKRDVIGKNILDLLPDVKETDRYDRYKEVIKTGEPFFVDGFVSHPKLGDMYLAVRVFKVGNGLGIITTDVTEQKRAVEERERLIKELEAKNAEMERFTYTVSHDLRSPLVTIHGFAGVLRKDIGQNNREKAEADLKFIEDAATKMDRLLSDTLRLSRIGRVVNPLEDVPFGELVQEALEQTAAKIKSSGTEVSVAETFPAVHVDRMRIIEVLGNLIENSINYMGEESHPRMDIGYRVEGEETVFFVKDNGLGIDKSQHEKVFGLFYKMDGNSRGTGAGLAIVKRIIEVHEGRIWIESEKDKGCTVCFTLPVV
jgi:PAS domain S-box-containing protein